MKSAQSRGGKKAFVRCLAFGVVVFMFVFTLHIIREGDLKAYYDFSPSTDTALFRHVTKGTQRVEVGNSVTLTGWRARNFVRHVRFRENSREATTPCGGSTPIYFYDSAGYELTAMNYCGDSANVSHLHSGSMEHSFLETESAHYIGRTVSPVYSNQ
jgi:hypothetical protein